MSSSASGVARLRAGDDEADVRADAALFVDPAETNLN
jgi:hypothetical protein